MKTTTLIVLLGLLFIALNAFAESQLDPLLGTTWRFENGFVKEVTFSSELSNCRGKDCVHCWDQNGRTDYVYWGGHDYGDVGYIMTFTHQEVDREYTYVFQINSDEVTGRGRLASCYTINSIYYGLCGSSRLENVELISAEIHGSIKATLIDSTYADPIQNRKVTYNLTLSNSNLSGTVFSNYSGEIFIEELNPSNYDLQLEIDGYQDKNVADIMVQKGKTNNIGRLNFFLFEHYTVTFQDHDGTELKSETVLHGNGATAPQNPIRVGYSFTGWNQAFNRVTSNLTVTAQYDILSFEKVFILSNTSPDYTILSGSDAIVYGTSSSNNIALESGARAELINFPGFNAVQIQSSSNLFTVLRSGTVVTFQGDDGTILKIPATTSVQTVEFSDGMPMTLNIHGGQVMLDDQEITTNPSSIEGSPVEPVACGAYVAPNVWKEFDCYNLAAIGKTTNDDPFTPSWRLIGGYWQWGRKGPDPSQWYDTYTEHFAHGPTGPGQDEANEGEISGWDDNYAPDGAWSDEYKTANDPCPEGFRVPTIRQWEGLLDNNNQGILGTWSNSATNYSSTRSFGDKLMLPAAGYRDGHSGTLHYRGNYGAYWSSSEDGSYHAWFLLFGSSNAHSDYFGRRLGHSVRCVAE